MEKDKIRNLKEIEIYVLLLKERVEMRNLWKDLDESETEREMINILRGIIKDIKNYSQKIALIELMKLIKVPDL